MWSVVRKERVFDKGFQPWSLSRVQVSRRVTVSKAAAGRWKAGWPPPCQQQATLNHSVSLYFTFLRFTAAEKPRVSLPAETTVTVQTWVWLQQFNCGCSFTFFRDVFFFLF